MAAQMINARSEMGGGNVVPGNPVWFVGNTVEIFLDKLFPPG